MNTPLEPGIHARTMKEVVAVTKLPHIFSFCDRSLTDRTRGLKRGGGYISGRGSGNLGRRRYDGDIVPKGLWLLGINSSCITATEHTPNNELGEIVIREVLI